MFTGLEVYSKKEQVYISKASSGEKSLSTWDVSTWNNPKSLLWGLPFPQNPHVFFWFRPSCCGLWSYGWLMLVVSDHRRLWHNPKQTSKLGWMHIPVLASTKYPLQCRSHVRSQSLFCEIPNAWLRVNRWHNLQRNKNTCIPVANRIAEATNPNCRPARLCHYLHSEVGNMPPRAGDVGKSQQKIVALQWREIHQQFEAFCIGSQSPESKPKRLPSDNA